MSRPRKQNKDNWLPDYVYRGKSAYEFRPPEGRYKALYPLMREDGKVIETPDIKIKVLEAYQIATKEPLKNVDFWLTKFFASDRFLRLDKSTQADYQRYANITKKADDPKSRNGVRYVFGDMMPGAVKPHHIRKYMDYWGKAGKFTTANRHLSLLQVFFNWAREHNAGVGLSPAHKITKFPEKKRKNYVTDDQYEKLLKAAMASNTPYMGPLMEVAYLCGLRLHEVLKINIEDITPKGLAVSRGKGSEGEITEISPRLQAAIDYAISLHKPPEPLRNRPLIRNTRCGRVTTSAAHQAFDNIRKSAGLPHVWIHDFKKKAGSEGKDLGHRTQAMRDLYDLLPKVKRPTK